jgi:hypothetical protein
LIEADRSGTEEKKEGLFCLLPFFQKTVKPISFPVSARFFLFTQEAFFLFLQ